MICKDKNYYVYHLISTENDKIFYVGKGSGNRMYEHEKIAKNNRKNKLTNPKLYNKISSLFNKGYEMNYTLAKD